MTVASCCLHLSVFCTRTNKLEVDLDAVEAKQKEVHELRDQAGNNVFKRFYVQLKRRTAFLATPPILWLFIILLGIFSALSLYVWLGDQAGVSSFFLAAVSADTWQRVFRDMLLARLPRVFSCSPDLSTTLF